MRRFLLTASLSLLMLLPPQTGFALGPESRSCLRAGGIVVLMGSVSGMIVTAVLAGVTTNKGCDSNSAFNTSVTVTNDYPCKICHSYKSPNCCISENYAGCHGAVTYVDSTCQESRIYCENENQTRINAMDVRDWPSTYKYIGISLGMTAITVAVTGLLVGSCVKCKPRTPKELPDDRAEEL